MGLVIERLALRPLLGQPALAIVMMTIALAGVMDGIAIMGWGGEYQTYHDVLPEISLQVGRCLHSSVVAAGTDRLGHRGGRSSMFIFRFTKIGLAMRATAEDEQVTRSLGIRATMVYALVWVIACVVGVVGGRLAGRRLRGVATAGRDRSEGPGGGHPGRSRLHRRRHRRAASSWESSENLAAGYLDPLMPSGGGLANVFPFIVMHGRAYLQAARTVRLEANREGVAMRLPSGTFAQSYGQDMALVRTKTQLGLPGDTHGLSLHHPPVGLELHSDSRDLMGITIISVHGLNILTGNCGLVSMGHSGFMMVGGYAMAILCSKVGLPFWLALPISGLIAGVVGIIFGLPSLRIKGFYLIMATVAAYFIIHWLVLQFRGLTGGTEGLSVPPAELFGLSLEGKATFFYVVMVLAVLATVVAKNILRTRAGRAFVAIRDNDLAAEVMGVNLFSYKLQAFFIGCVFAGSRRRAVRAVLLVRQRGAVPVLRFGLVPGDVDRRRHGQRLRGHLRGDRHQAAAAAGHQAGARRWQGS